MEITALFLQAGCSTVMATLVAGLIYTVKSIKPYGLGGFWYYLVLLPALGLIALTPHGWHYLLADAPGQHAPPFLADLIGTLAGLGLGWTIAKLLPLGLRD